MDDDNGSLVLDNEVVNAKYLLIRKSRYSIASDIFRITSKGPKVFSKSQLEELGYPNPTKEYYLVIEIETVDIADFGNAKWEFKELIKYKDTIKKYPNPRIGPGVPFTVSLKELMIVKVK